MRYYISVEGREHVVDVEAESNQKSLTVRDADGVLHSVEIRGRGPDFRVSRLGRVEHVVLDASGKTPSYVGGSLVSIRVESEQDRASKAEEASGAASGAQTLRAQMPGKIVKVTVKLGERVPAGHAVVVMEAMKMQNDLCASHAGTVTRVLVEEGHTVEAGAVLIELTSA
jgi:biotin carboxyl carrier protein